MPRLLTLLIGCTLLVVHPASSASARYEAGGGSHGTYIWAVARSDGGISAPRGAGVTCTSWQPVGDGTGPTGDYGAYKYIDGVVHWLYRRNCPAPSGPPQYAWVPLVRNATNLAELAYDRVVRQLPKPRPGFAPPAGQNVTQVGTWFWTDRSTWRRISATAYVPGLRATVTATPVALRFEPGDGDLGTGVVTCPGPGQVWQPADGDDATSSCQYTYRHSSTLSPSGGWNATLAIDWRVGFSASNGARADLANLSTAADATMRVGEIQAVITGS